MKALGVEGGREVHDELFDMWDVDSSGSIDFKEMDKALHKATRKLATLDVGGDEASDEGKVFATMENASALTGGVKNANVKLAKEKSDASRKVAMEKALSPRSQQLKEIAEQEAKQAAYEEELRIAAEDEDHTTWTVPKFLASKGISKVIAAAMQLPPRVSGDASHFKYCKTLEKEKLAEALEAANLSGLTEFIYTCIQSLQGQKTASAEKLNDKFATTAKFQMTYGSLSLFYGGLESLLGPPKMYKGPQHTEKSLFNTMEMEHTAGPDAATEFEANMGLKTTAEKEWEIVVAPKEGVEYAEREGYRESHATWCRVARPLKQLLEDMETKCNERLRKDGHSELIKEELVAGRLYTGPVREGRAAAAAVAAVAAVAAGRCFRWPPRAACCHRHWPPLPLCRRSARAHRPPALARVPCASCPHPWCVSTRGTDVRQVQHDAALEVEGPRDGDALEEGDERQRLPDVHPRDQLVRHQAVEADQGGQGVARHQRRDAAQGVLGSQRDGRARRHRVRLLLDHGGPRAGDDVRAGRQPRRRVHDLRDAGASRGESKRVRPAAPPRGSAPRLRPAAPPRGSDRVALLFLTLPPWPPALSPA